MIQIFLIIGLSQFALAKRLCTSALEVASIAEGGVQRVYEVHFCGRAGDDRLLAVKIGAGEERFVQIPAKEFKRFTNAVRFGIDDLKKISKAEGRCDHISKGSVQWEGMTAVIESCPGDPRQPVLDRWRDVALAIDQSK